MLMTLHLLVSFGNRKDCSAFVLVFPENSNNGRSEVFINGHGDSSQEQLYPRKFGVLGNVSCAIANSK